MRFARARRLGRPLMSVALAAIACGVTACSRDDDPLAVAGLADGTSWRLVTFVVAGEEVVPAAEAPVTLARENGGVSGSTGCNRYRGDLSATDGAEVLFPPMAMTRRMCVDEELQRVESMYVAALADVTQARSTDDLLILSSATATLIFGPDEVA